MSRCGTDASRTDACYHESLKSAITRFLPCTLFSAPGKAVRWSGRYLAIIMVLMSWSGAAGLNERFVQARQVLCAMFPGRRRPGRTYQGLIQALLARGQALLELLRIHLQAQVMPLSGKHWMFKGRFIPFGVDGSKVECPRTGFNELAFGCAGIRHSAPQQFVTTLLHLGSGLVWDFRTGSGLSSERGHLLHMLKGLPPAALIIADAGFTGYAFLSEIISSGRHFLIRAGSSVQLLRKLGFVIEERVGERGSTVYLWPEGCRKTHPPLVLRLIVLRDGRNRQMHLLCSVTDDAQLSDSEAAELYSLRWGVELYYRSLKQTLRRNKVCGGSPLVAQAELNWAMIGLWLLSLMGSGAIMRSGGNPRRLSVAAAVQQVRQAMRHPTRRAGRNGLERQLSHARIDRFIRRRSKRARNPIKGKAAKPPGITRARKATKMEVLLAQEFIIQRHAA